MEEERLKAILESLLFAAGGPVALPQLATALENVSREEIRKALAAMAAANAMGARGIVLEEVAGGYQLRTPREHALYVRRLLAAKPPRLSRPLLETLAIIAYRQPITRPEIEQLRGVDCGGVMETLLERQLVKIAGRKEAPGRPLEYATTAGFLELFGLKDLESLPDLAELRALEANYTAPPAFNESPAAADLAAVTAGSNDTSSGASGTGESHDHQPPVSEARLDATYDAVREEFAPGLSGAEAEAAPAPGPQSGPTDRLDSPADDSDSEDS